MTKHNRICEFVFEKAQFCPICGEKLLITTKLIGKKPFRTVFMDVKTCPDGHGDLIVEDFRGGPDIVFEVPESFYTEVD